MPVHSNANKGDEWNLFPWISISFFLLSSRRTYAYMGSHLGIWVLFFSILISDVDFDEDRDGESRPTANTIIIG